MAQLKIPSGVRKVTRHQGVYTRTAKNKLGPDGRPDVCFDIIWQDKNKKTQYQKIGWKSDGVTIQQAIDIRAKYIQKDRFPESIEKQHIKRTEKEYTLNDVWKQYNEFWIPKLKGNKKLTNTYNIYIAPAFGKLKISEITTLKIDKFTHQLLTNKSITGKNNLQPTSVKLILSDLRRLLKKAQEWDLYNGKIPTIKMPQSDSKRERYLSKKEAKRFLEELQLISCNLFYIAKISLYTGLRLSEVVNLKVNDININEKLIYIQNGKTGYRVAYIPDDLVCDINNLISKSNSFLFTREDGRPLTTNNISSKYSVIINIMGFNKDAANSKHKFVFHTLRHTFCSWLAIKGVPLYTIGNLVGHSTIEMTQRYAKLSPDVKRTAIEYIGQIMKSDTNEI